MSPRVLSPAEVAGVVAKKLKGSWAERICAELAGEAQRPVDVGLRPGVDGSAAVDRLGHGTWTRWHLAWSGLALEDLPGIECEYRDIRVSGVPNRRPWCLRIRDLEAGLRLLALLGGPDLDLDVDRVRRIATRLHDAGAELTPGTLRAACRLSDTDVDVAVEAVAWLRQHPDLSGWTTRQLPVPTMHTKWLGAHGKLIEDLLRRGIRDETRPRLSVVHLTYVDPGYLATGQRRHDAWTTGDNHHLAYRPRIVLVVENRDCRLWFPELVGTVVVEGSGKAVAASLSRIDWLVNADHLGYWGDVDSDGFAILDSFRAELEPRGVLVHSLLMDTAALARYAHLGVNHDKNGDPLKPCTRRLPHLTETEAACYASVATAGEARFRRIEQERIDLADAVEALRQLVHGH